MRPYAERYYFNREVRAAFHLATFIVDRLKQRPYEVRCHELALAIGPVLFVTVPHFAVSVWSGKYGAVEHSWLKVRSLINNPHESYILDVYAVGRMPQVQLIDGTMLLPEARTYVPGTTGLRDDTDHTIVTELSAEMRRTLDDHRQPDPLWIVHSPEVTA